MTLAFEDANLSFLTLLSVADIDAQEHVDYRLIDTLMLKFGQDSEALFGQINYFGTSNQPFCSLYLWQCLSRVSIAIMRLLNYRCSLLFFGCNLSIDKIDKKIVTMACQTD